MKKILLIPYSDEYNAYNEKLEKIHKEFSSFIRLIQVKQCLTLLRIVNFRFEDIKRIYTLLIFAFVKIELTEKVKNEILELLNELLIEQKKIYDKKLNDEKNGKYSYNGKSMRLDEMKKSIEFMKILVKIISKSKQNVLDLIGSIYELIGPEAYDELYKIFKKKKIVPNPYF